MKESCSQLLSYIDLENVSFSYENSERILENISISFNRAEFTGIIGSNGSGKTTLGKLMTGIFKPVEGKVFIDGQDTQDISLGKVGQLVAYLFQQPERQLFNPTVREEIGFVANFMGESDEQTETKVKKMIENFSLKGLEESSPYKISRGEKQRTALASILINDPEFIVLDEPTTGLDIVRKKELAEILNDLKSRGLGMAVISHDHDFLDDNADRILCLKRGGLSET